LSARLRFRHGLVLAKGRNGDEQDDQADKLWQQMVHGDTPDVPEYSCLSTLSEQLT
jgi:hypothetical protein